MRKVAVIGLGRFGMALARNLSQSGVQVIAMDRDGKLTNELKDEVSIAVRGDSTDQSVLLSQDIDKVDVCVVSIGENFEAALLTTVIVKQLGVPEIVCRAQSAFHAEIFRKIGATKVIQPEQEAGANLARQLSNPQLVDFIRLADGFTLLEFLAPRAFWGKTIAEIGIRNKYHVNLVVVRKPILCPEGSPEPQVYKTFVPRPDQIIEANDMLVMVGAEESLTKLPRE